MQDADRRRARAWLAGLVAMAAAAPGGAADGVLEINQTCATQTGCFPGDEPGFPVTITRPGSYAFTSNLGITFIGVGNLAQSIVVISADHVDLDLRGFSLGCAKFATIPPRCTGTGDGIEASNVSGTVVRNGKVRGVPGAGVRLTDGDVVGIRAVENGSGISIGSGSVRESTTSHNVGRGISAGSVLISQNVVRDNGAQGIVIGRNGIVESNLVHGNDSDGIFAQSIGALIRNNTSSENTNFGIRMGFKDAYSGNSAQGNTAGSISGGTNLGGNYCAAANGSNTCP